MPRLRRCLRLRRRLTRATLAGVLLVAVSCTSADTPVPRQSPDDATAPPTGPEPTGPEPTGPEPTGPVAPTSVTLQAPPDGSLRVRGLYPRVRSRCAIDERRILDARYPGTLRIERAEDGTLSIAATVPFREYLEGIAEVPSSWPMAALEAQAIAARSYALATTGWSGAEGETLDQTICSTTACQVYRGIPLTPSPTTRRWYRAVRRTSGQMILYQGRPAETVYFSTSNGRTYGNEDVFGSSPLPYLRPVTESDDGASPVSRWSVRIPFGDLGRFLAAAGEWPRGRAISGARLDGGTVMVSGGGESRSVDLGTFRSAVNAWAHCLEPAGYPPGGLPTTIPSRWLTFSSGGGSLTVTGRGWGHGAGMVQWGAYGKARRGLSAAEILSFYYGGFRPEPFPEPGLIHVEITSGLTSLLVRPSGTGATLNGEELGPGRIAILGGDELTVRAPSA